MCIARFAPTAKWDDVAAYRRRVDSGLGALVSEGNAWPVVRQHCC